MLVPDISYKTVKESHNKSHLRIAEKPGVSLGIKKPARGEQVVGMGCLEVANRHAQVDVCIP